MAGYQDLIGWYQRAYDEARRANEDRYQQMIGIYNQRLNAGQGMFGQASSEVNRAFTQRSSAAQQGLVSAGLANTTVLPSVLAGIDRARGEAMAGVAQRAAAYQASLQGDLAQAIERRTDEYPSMQMLLQLAQGLGSAGQVPAGMQMYQNQYTPMFPAVQQDAVSSTPVRSSRPSRWDVINPEFFT